METETISPADASQSHKLVDLKNTVHAPVLKWAVNAFEKPIEHLFSINRINNIHQQAAAEFPRHGTAGDFFGLCLKNMGISYDISVQDIAKIPTEGPLVVVANHPFGAVEGIILGHILFRVRPDIKIIGNYLLQQIPQIRTSIIPVDPFGSRSSIKGNAAGYKDAVRWTARGGAVLTFPAGAVSHIQPRKLSISDPVWSDHVAGIIGMSHAKVLPIYFPGTNSVLFNLLGLIHPLLRTLLLPRELTRQQNSTIRLVVGKPIPWLRLKQFQTRRELTEYLRYTTYFLKHRLVKPKIIIHLPKSNYRRSRPFQPVINPIGPERLQRELETLPPDCLLYNQKEFDIYCAKASQLPDIMKEIGRLREISFRDVNEGTGRALDVDKFDEYYLQLFLWNRQSREIAGAYRLGMTEAILDRYGSKGLYTHSLFKFRPAFLQNLNNSIELGRSFIRPEYQRKRGCLSMLWRGIGEYINLNPQYTILFGPVSISCNYHVVSRNLIVSFLRNEGTDRKTATLVKPRNPYTAGLFKRFKDNGDALPVNSIENVSLLISEIEKDGKGVPPLIKHYLKLDGKFIGFNVDPNFSDVVDGLVLVDLHRTDHRLLKRFMGEDGFERYWSYHNKKQEAAA
ncbi:MAG: lysophospholipid acyltransferase family protein [Desulfobacteraceae bacterium]|nr:lysophospholipid acyltransferase family protein [Desulfobacteraceae bacterium]